MPPTKRLKTESPQLEGTIARVFGGPLLGLILGFIDILGWLSLCSVSKAFGERVVQWGVELSLYEEEQFDSYLKLFERFTNLLDLTLSRCSELSDCTFMDWLLDKLPSVEYLTIYDNDGGRDFRFNTFLSNSLRYINLAYLDLSVDDIKNIAKQPRLLDLNLENISFKLQDGSILTSKAWISYLRDKDDDPRRYLLNLAEKSSLPFTLVIDGIRYN